MFSTNETDISADYYVVLVTQHLIPYVSHKNFPQDLTKLYEFVII